MNERFAWAKPIVATASMLSDSGITYDQDLPYAYYIRGSFATNVKVSFNTNVDIVAFGYP